MLKWLRGADVITLLIFRILTITSINDEKYYLTFAQIPSSLSRQQDYGPSSESTSGGGGSNGNNIVGGGGGGSSINAGAGTNIGNGGNGNVGEILAPKSFPLSGQEPTCEELRAMWRFSKRQSRAPEITNELPTYRDPFAYNIWEPYYATTRSMGGMRLLPRYRDSNRPVYGRIIHREPLMRLAERTKNLETMSRLYNPDNIGKNPSVIEPRRRVQFRFSGGTSSSKYNGGSNMNGYNNGMVNVGGSSGGGIIGGSISTNPGGSNVNTLTPHYGSFQKLKELIWTERARELAQQRKAEEMAARVAVLKEIANGIGHTNGRNTKSKTNLSPVYDENRSPDTLISSRSAASSNLDQDNHYKTIVTLPGSMNSGGASTGLSSSLSSSSAGLGSGSSSIVKSSGSGGIYLPPSVQLPGTATKQSGQQQNIQQQSIIKGGFPMRPSHFRERNRVLFRQTGTPLDYYQRESRSSIESPLPSQQQQQQQQQEQQQHFDNDGQLEQLLLTELSKYLHQQKQKDKQLKQKQDLEDQLLLQQYMMMEDQQQQQQQPQQMQQFDEDDKYYDYPNFMF